MRLAAEILNTTSNTHKEHGLTQFVDEHPAKVYTAITTGNRGKLIERILLQKQHPARLVPLVSKHIVGWDVEQVVLPFGRVFRPYERAPFLAEKLGLSPEQICDLTDVGTPNIEAFLPPDYFANIDHVLVPIGSGGLYLGFVEATTKYNTTVWGFVPEKQNGVLVSDSAYRRKNNELHFTTYIGDTIAQHLACPYTSKRQDIIRTTKYGHKIFAFQDEELLRASVLAQTLFPGHDVDSYAGLVGLLPTRNKKLRGKNVLVVLTGTIQHPEQIAYQQETNLSFCGSRVHGYSQDLCRGEQWMEARWKHGTFHCYMDWHDQSYSRTLRVDLSTRAGILETGQVFDVRENHMWEFPVLCNGNMIEWNSYNPLRQRDLFKGIV